MIERYVSKENSAEILYTFPAKVFDLEFNSDKMDNISLEFVLYNVNTFPS